MSVPTLTDKTKTDLRLRTGLPRNSALNYLAYLTAIQTNATNDQVQRIPLQDFKLPASLLQLAAAAGSSILGFASGTHGSASPALIGNAASGNTKTDSARILITVSSSYTAAATVTLRVRCAATVGLATVSTTIDALVYRSDLAVGVSADLCTTAAQQMTTGYADYDFVLTPTSMAPSDVLDILITGSAVDTGGTIGTIIKITNVELRYG